MIPLDAYGSTSGLFNLRLCPSFDKFYLNTCPRKNTVDDYWSHFFIISTVICHASLMLLVIQSGDIEINPGLIQRVIWGSFYQGDQRFGQMAGTQCMCNALYSVGYSIIKKVRHWTTWDMDYIIITGNSLYSTLGFRSRLLSADELPDSISIKNILISISKTNLETGLTHFSSVSHFYTPWKRFSDVFREYRNVTLD